MKLTIEESRLLALNVLCISGMPADHSGIVADHLVDAMMSGHDLFGLPRVLPLVEGIKAKGPGGAITILSEDSTSAVFDGGDTNGYVTSLIAMDKAIALAENSGIGIVAVRNTWNSGRLAYYVERAARRDLIAFHSVNTTARAAAFGGIDRIFGTNPLSFAFPSETEPFVLDFSASATSWGELLGRLQSGQLLDEGWAVDADGEPTRDPAAAIEGALLPWGGYRGSGLMLVAQIFGILAGSKVIIDGVADFGLFFLVIDPAKFMPRAEFKRKVTQLKPAIMRSRIPAGGSPIRLPGQVSQENRKASKRLGLVEVDAKVVADLQAAIDEQRFSRTNDQA